MRRRAFIAGILLIATAHPAHTQERSRVPQIGLLDPGIPHLFAALGEGLRSLGYMDGENIRFVLMSADGRPDNIPPLAAELVRLNVDVVVTAGTLPVRSAAHATSTIPMCLQRSATLLAAAS